MSRSRLTAWFVSGSMASVLAEWLVIVVLAYVYAGPTLLDFDPHSLQQTGEHNESSTLPLLIEVGIRRYAELPLWNPYMRTGFPHAGDFVNHFWNPFSALPVIAFGGINGMKVSVFIAFVLAGIGQWLFAQLMGVRGVVRLWAAILYMTSGGLALLWNVGWYALLLGAAWFPWCLASTWWAVHRGDRTSIGLAGFCVAILLATGSAYYPLYLAPTLGVLVGVAMLYAPASQRWRYLSRSAAIVSLGVALAAVAVLPLVDGARFTGREAGPDREQRGSQPIHYALINYVVSQPEWFRTEVLGTQGGWNWFYIGPLPMLAMTTVPLAFRSKRLRKPIVLLGVMSLFLLAWYANRHTPVRYVYDVLPVLYLFRFPGRLLIIAAGPILILAALGLQYVVDWANRSSWPYRLEAVDKGNTLAGVDLRMGSLVYAALSLVLALSIIDVFSTNKSFAFSPGRVDQKSFTALNWLKERDPGVYYTNIGGGSIIWSWTPAAYILEVPIINFKYNRDLTSYETQTAPGSPFKAMPKYMLAQHNQPRPSSANLLNDFGGIGLWYLPDALPFAFAVPAGRLESGSTLTKDQARAIDAARLTPNSVEVRAVSPGGDQLVVLVSDYPGWRLYVDGQPTPVVTANGYLGASLVPGEHTYRFVFLPSLHVVGLAVSAAALALICALFVADLRSRRVSAELTAAEAATRPV